MTEEGMQGGDERGRIGARCRRWGGGREEEKEGERGVGRERYGKNESENGCSCFTTLFSNSQTSVQWTLHIQGGGPQLKEGVKSGECVCVHVCVCMRVCAQACVYVIG